MIRAELLWVRGYMAFLNFILAALEKLLFRKVKNPRNIVVYKVGNIGDVVVMVPVFIAIRESFPNANITLLTSPGRKGAPGAAELLAGASYIDDFEVYYADDSKKELIRRLRAKKFDLFIQIADDWADFRTVLRNLLFAKLIGIRGGFGFRLRTLLNVFWNAQVDNVFKKHESQAVLDILKKGGVKADKIKYEFPATEGDIFVVDQMLSAKWANYNDELLVGIAPGGKGEEKRWSPERFGEIAKYLVEKYGAKILITGAGKDDELAAEVIQKDLFTANVFNAVSRVPLKQLPLVIKQCDFLVANDSGNMHTAAAVGVPAVALFSVRNILGGWFPWGEGHEVLYHKNLKCDYRNAVCVRQSMEFITVEEVKAACDRMVAKIANSK